MLLVDNEQWWHLSARNKGVSRQQGVRLRHWPTSDRAGDTSQHPTHELHLLRHERRLRPTQGSQKGLEHKGSKVMKLFGKHSILTCNNTLHSPLEISSLEADRTSGTSSALAYKISCTLLDIFWALTYNHESKMMINISKGKGLIINVDFQNVFKIFCHDIELLYFILLHHIWLINKAIWKGWVHLN